MDRIYLIIGNREEDILGMAKTKKDARQVQKEADQDIAEERGFSDARQARQYHGELTTVQRWEYDTTDKRYYCKGEVFV